MSNLSSLQVSDQESAAVQKTPNRVTLQSMEEKIDHVQYFYPEKSPQMTIAVLTLKNGYVIVGKSAPADPENFNAELGKKFAFEDAIRQMWPLEGYALRERLQSE